MLGLTYRLIPWIGFFLLAWHERSHTNTPWLIALALSFACGWAMGRRRSWSRRMPKARPQTASPAPRVDGFASAYAAVVTPPRTMRAVHMEIERPPEVIADLVSALVNLGVAKPRAKVTVEQVISELGAGTDPSRLLRKSLQMLRSPEMAMVRS